MMVLLRGFNTMAADLAGDQWNEGDVSCSVVRRVVISDSFYVLDGLLHTFMTILNEFGAFEEKIEAELNVQIPLLATTKILMECVKTGMGREAAHQLIKKHSTSNTAGNFFETLAKDEDFPLSLDQLKSMIVDPSVFTGMASEQSELVRQRIKKVTDNKIDKVELSQLR
jgi:adenylosuccinate lyase